MDKEELARELWKIFLENDGDDKKAWNAMGNWLTGDYYIIPRKNVKCYEGKLSQSSYIEKNLKIAGLILPKLGENFIWDIIKKHYDEYVQLFIKEKQALTDITIVINNIWYTKQYSAQDIGRGRKRNQYNH